MKTRRTRHIIRNYDDQNKRASHLLLSKVESLITASEPVLKAHTYWYGDAIKQFNLLKTAFADVEALSSSAEVMRPIHVRDPKLNEDLKNLRTQERVITQSMADLRSGKTLGEWQREELQVGRALRAAHKAQLDEMRGQEQEAKAIFAKLNATKSEHYEVLEAAQRRLDELEKQADSTTCCVSSSKQRHLNEMVERQGVVVEELNNQAKAATARVLEETVRKPALLPTNNKETDELQKRFDRAREMVRLCQDHQAELLAEKQKDLDAIQSEKRKVIRSINRQAQRHYSDINSQVMHGILRVYERLNAYKTWFDLAVSKYGKHVNSKGEVADYSWQLAVSKSRVERLMHRLWSHELNRLSAKAISSRFKQLPLKTRENVLAQKPDAHALQQVMGAASSVAAHKVSTTSIFKKPVHPDTAAKRAYFKKEVRFKM